MTAPTFAQLSDPTQGGPGFGPEPPRARLVTILSIIASGQYPDGSPIYGIGEITSTGNTVTVTNPTGPVTNLEVAGGSDQLPVFTDDSVVGISLTENGTGGIGFTDNGGGGIWLNSTYVGFYSNEVVLQHAAISAPTGGVVVDTEARAAIVSILNAIGAAAGGIGITA